MKRHVSGCLGFIVGALVALGVIFPLLLLPFEKDNLVLLIGIWIFVFVPISAFGFASIFNKHGPKEYSDKQLWD